MLIKKNLLNYNIMLFTIIVSFSLVFLIDSPIYHVYALWLPGIMSILITRFEITQPFVWFSCSFALYNTAYTLLYILGYSNTGYDKMNILLPLVALTIVFLFVGMKKPKDMVNNQMKKSDLIDIINKKKILGYIILVLLLTLFVCDVMLFISPFDSKTELLSNGNIFFIIGVYCTRFISFFCCLYLLLFSDLDKKKSKLIIFISAILVVSLSLFTGERDAMFRFFVILFMTLTILKKVSKKTILSLLPIGILFLIASRYFKYYFVGGGVKDSLGEETFIYSFLTTDFHAAGENLQILLNNPWTESLHGYSLIAIDFISPFIPGGLFLNVGVWFNNVFYPNSYSRAFTLVGQGYVVGGVMGIIIVFLILSIAIKFVYIQSTKNLYWLAIYIYSIPTVISAFRSTLGTAFTGVIRIAFFSIVIYYFLLLLLNNKKRQRVYSK